MNNLKMGVLNYENKIISIFLQKRNKFIDNIEIIKFNELPNDKLSVCIDDIKEVIDSVKIACDNIDHFLLNYSNNFNNTDNIDKRKKLQEIVATYYFFNGLFLLNESSLESESYSDCSELSLESYSEISERSEPSLESYSESSFNCLLTNSSTCSE